MLRTALPKITCSPLPGPKAKSVLERRASAMPKAIHSIYPCVIARGEGAMIEDMDGNILLDWIGGVGVLNLGYSHPDILDAVKNQADLFLHSMMNITTHESYIKLAERLNALAPVRGSERNTMLANSGAEAVENAVKIARAYTGRPNVLVFSGAFHGRTLLAMTMTANKKYAVGMGPFPDGVYRVDFPYLYRAPEGYSEEQAIAFYYDKLKQAFIEASPADQIAAMVFEPVQGEGGFVPAPFAWVKAVRQLCDEHGILMIADEVQTGFARSGKLFASCYWQEQGFEPDILTCAKSIAAGLPLSAVVARREIFDAVPGGTIGGTYCGNAVACEAALKVIEVIERDNLCGRAIEIGAKYVAAIDQMVQKYDFIGDVRGIGSMLGVELVKDRQSKEPAPEYVSQVVQYCVQHGLLIESAGLQGNVLRFLCPLVVTDEQLQAGLDILDAAFAAVQK